MLRTTKRFAWAGVLAVSLRMACGFSLLGPPVPPDSTWQVQDNGMNVALWADLGGPMNIGEGYRRNVPLLYYSFDSSFSDYFGSNGLHAVDQAYSVLNGLKNVSSYSPDLSEFPLDSRRINYLASALGMMDLKSETLALMMEQMGLGEPVRYIWNIHNRYHFPAAPACPAGMDYLVVKRNYELVPSALDQLQYSSYVNGALYSYYIQEYCASPPAPAGWPLSEAIEIPVDPLSTPSAVADFRLSLLSFGTFYTGLTRDDVAGLRYLLRSGNVNWEGASPDSLLLFTNTASSSQTLLISSNLTLLAEQSYTNADAALLALYPNLVIANTTFVFTNLVTTNVTGYYTNYPWDPYSAPASLVLVTNFDTNVATVYYRDFANVITNTYYTSGVISILETNVAYVPWSIPGTLSTNVTVRTVQTNILMGDFYVFPSNACGVQIIRTQLVKLLTFTNTPVAITNIPVQTNLPTGGLTNAQSFSRSFVYYFTNHQIIVYPVECTTNWVGLRRGIEKVSFARRDFDSLLGRFFYPVTNYYSSIAVTNSTNWVQTFQRVVTVPDFLIAARDFLPGPGALPAWSVASRSLNFNSTNKLANLTGPGTIESPTLLQFNKSGPIFENQSPSFLDELTAIRWEIWGSYDESTNAPIIYANGLSIDALENMLFMQVTTASLPDGAVGHAYPGAQLSGSGGQLPYSWSLTPGSPGLPPGLVLNADGTIVGTPTLDGVYDFTVRMTDAGSRFVDRPLVLTIRP